MRQGASANGYEERGARPLHVASEAGHAEVVSVLLASGADHDLLDNQGRSAFQLACANGHDEIAEMIRRHPHRGELTRIKVSTSSTLEQVLLHIYDLGNEPKIKRINRVSNALGGGLYHAAIEHAPPPPKVVGITEGLEWSFGYVENGSGVYNCPAKRNEQHFYRETIQLGYHLILRNCQSFCAELAQQLEVAALPDWAAIDGIALLKTKGIQVVKFDRTGVPRLTTFKISEDETQICWEGKLKHKSIELADVVELLVGHESAVFQRTSLRVPPAEHLSSSLVLTGALPAPPSSDNVERQTSKVFAFLLMHSSAAHARKPSQIVGR
ncbi:MAG: hypothetical protein SGPRY_003422 [Prymnesium sp.]